MLTLLITINRRKVLIDNKEEMLRENKYISQKTLVYLKLLIRVAVRKIKKKIIDLIHQQEKKIIKIFRDIIMDF